MFEDIPVDLDPAHLTVGENVLAIHGLNFELSSSDLLFLPVLEVGSPSGYDTWINQFASLSGASLDFNADGEGDGLSNGFEYLLSKNPTVGDRVAPFAVELSEAGELFARATLPIDLPEDVVLELQGSYDLQSGSWETLGTVASPEGWSSEFDRTSSVSQGIEHTLIGPLEDPRGEAFYVRGVLTTR